MIRPFTCLCMLLAAGAGLYLYQEKHRAQVLDREIMRVVKATDVARERTGLLRAEWALLNEPDRLAALAERHLALKPLLPAQFVPLADLASRLPAPVVPGSPDIAMDDAAPLDPATTLAAQEPTPPVPLPAPPPPAAAAQVAPSQVAPSQVAASQVAALVRVATIAKPASPVATIQVAAAPAKPLHLIKPRPSELAEPFAAALPPPKPISTPVILRAVATSVLARSVTPALHAPMVQRVEALVPQPAVGSSLGMARTMLPPPVPVAVTSALGAAPVQ